MDKTKIKNFAITAREKLIESVTDRLNEIDITADHIGIELPISTPDKKYYRDEAHPLTGSQIKWRQEIVRELQTHNYADDPKQVFNDFVEEVAYTWFNRIIAIRFMEVNNYLPSRVRVLSSEEGNNDPDILNAALDIEDDLGGYSDAERQLINDALMDRLPEKLDAAYAMLFIKQNDALAKILPGLFEQTKGYLKLLFTPKYTTGVIQSLITDIPEADFDVSQEGQVQIIGWLYQYYNTVPHEDAVNLNGKAIKKDQIPAATQLFTPDWIVKYMVDNSLGKYYLERHHNSLVKDELQYLLPDEIKEVDDPREVTEYKFLDNAMGSGHILIYAFDLLMKMYIEAGYSKRDAANKIVENNLYGLEIDKRAYQLAYFALMMKGREYDRRFLKKEHHINLYYFNDLHVPDDFYNYVSDVKDKEDLHKVLDIFAEAQELGSVAKVETSVDIDHLIDVVKGLPIDEGLDIYGYQHLRRHILKVLEIVKVMSAKYEAVVTNPPYMNKFDPVLKKYLKSNYKDYSKDLFSVFIYHNLQMLKDGGYAGYMTPLVWMFIKTYEPLRKAIINNSKIDSLIQFEYSAFEEATVPIDTFVLKNSNDKVGCYLRLSDFKGGMRVQEEKTLKAINDPDANYLYHTKQSNFDKIPGSPIAYWASENLIKDFEEGTPLGELVDANQGLATADNKRFLRQWFEVDLDNTSFNSHNIQESIESKKKWFPLNKGGAYRKWYGNYDYVVNWENDGYEIRHFVDSKGKQRSRPQNTEFYFKEAITWSDISVNNFALRFRTQGSIHESKGMSAFCNNSKQLLQILGTLNAKVGDYIFKIINPTISLKSGNFDIFPFKQGPDVSSIVEQNISLSKQDWDAFETSWDFQHSPLLTSSNKAASLQASYSNWEQEAESRFNQLKSNEEELNKIFIDLYGLQDELTPEEEDKDVSVRKADKERDIKAFLSYFIGCVFGRYSLDEDGLVYAGGQWDDSKYQTFRPNKDNIILLTDRQYFTDDRDIIIRLKEFLTTVFSPDTLADNLDFIAQTLSPKNFEKGDRAEDIIRNYFLNDFAKEHAKIYQKRPIYWEFNSGRNKGFKALMYLHRYQPDELAMVRTYLHELQAGLNNLLEVDKQSLDQASNSRDKSKYRKEINLLNKQSVEQVNYDQILGHLSQLQIELDLDDGVVENYQKLQQDKKLLTKI